MPWTPNARITKRPCMIKNLMDKMLFSRAEAELFVELFFEEIMIALENGEAVELPGFGKFTLSLIRYHQPRIHWTEGTLFTPMPHLRLYFRPYKSLTDRCQNPRNKPKVHHMTFWGTYEHQTGRPTE